MTSFFDWLRAILDHAKVWSMIQPWENGIRTRCGKHALLLPAGFYWRIPFLDEIRIVNTRLRMYPFPQTTITTRDGKTLTISGVIGFRVIDALRATLAFQQPEIVCSTYVQPLVTSYVRSRDFGEIKITEIETHCRESLAEFAHGVEFEFVRVCDFAAVKTFRLLQENWRATTSFDKHDRDGAA